MVARAVTMAAVVVGSLVSPVDVIGQAPADQAMVRVPAGSFTMGDGVAKCGEDEHAVTLTRDFLLGQHEVTNQEYLSGVQWAYDHGYVKATGSSIRDNLDGSSEELLDLLDPDAEIRFDGAGRFYLRESPSRFARSAYPNGYDPATHPVKQVTWYGAARYCDWLSLQQGLPRAYRHNGDWLCNEGDPYSAKGYRLPTDAEWEYAVQYDDGRVYAWGDGEPECHRGNFTHCVRWSTPVGSYPDAPASLGLADMMGNVCEWCNDWRVCDLGTARVTDPVGPRTGRYHVLRGASVFCHPLHVSRAFRGGCNFIGFRIAMTASS